MLQTLHADVSLAKSELNDIKDTLKVKQAGWSLLRSNKNVRRAVFLGVLLQAMQQFTSFNVIMYYSPEILSLGGFSSTEDQMIGTVINGIVFVLATLIAVYTVDKSGRKPALKIGFAVIIPAMVVMGLCMAVIEGGNPAPLGLLLIGYHDHDLHRWFAMIAGPIVWVLVLGNQPLKMREFGVACSTMTNWITCAVVDLLPSSSLIDALGSSMTFWMYAGLNAVFIALTLRFVPETKNVSLEQIEKNLMSGMKLKNIGVHGGND